MELWQVVEEKCSFGRSQAKSVEGCISNSMQTDQMRIHYNSDTFACMQNCMIYLSPLKNHSLVQTCIVELAQYYSFSLQSVVKTSKGSVSCWQEICRWSQINISYDCPYSLTVEKV